MPKNDVFDYIILELERLREASEKVSDFILDKVEYGRQRGSRKAAA